MTVRRFLLSLFLLIFLSFRTIGAGGNGLLFHATFDHGTDADTAAGSVRSQTNGKIGVVQSTVSSGAVRLGMHQEISWLQKENVNLKEGTVSFWMRAVDWNPAVGTPGYDWIFTIAGLGPEGDRIQIFKMPQTLLMCFVGREQKVKQLPVSTGGVEQGKWYFMTLTWQEESTALYINGRRRAQSRMTAEDIPRNTGTNIYLRSNCGTSDYDDLRIYDHALRSGEIENLYLQNLPMEKGKAVPYRPVVRIGRTFAVHRIDGRAERGEWNGTARIGNFLTIPEMTLSSAKSSVRMTYDDQALYVLFASRQKDRGEEKPGQVSSKTLWSVPSGEFLFQADDRPGAPVYQIAFNKFGQFLTFINGEKADWTAQVAATVRPDEWRAEIRIPFENTGFSRPALGAFWKANFADNLLYPQRFSNPSLSMAYADASNFWKVIFAEQAAPAVEAVHDAAGKQLRYRIQVSPEQRKNWTARIFVKKIPLNLKDLTGNLRMPTAVPGKVVLDREFPLEQLEKIPLPDAGRYLSRITVRDARKKTAYCQLVHFLVYDTFRIKPVFFSKQKKMEVHWTMNMPIQSSFQIRMEILSEGQKPASADSRTIAAGQTSGIIPFDMSGWDRLDYRIRAVFILPGRREVRELPFQCHYNAPWHGFFRRQKLGRTVPAPWKPIRLEKAATLKTLTQSYQLGKNGLPAVINVLGRKLTAAPVNLEIRTGGTALDQTAPVTWLEQEDYAVTWQTTFAGPDCRAVLKGRLEYDGMIRYDLEIIPGKETTRLTTLVLKVPVQKEIGRFMLPYAGPYQTWDMVTVPTDFSRHYEDAFMPHLWTGNHRVGLGWFAESDEHYRPLSRKRVVELTRQDRQVLMQINMVEKPLVLAGKTVYTFGLQATPAKTVPENWTNWHLASCLSTRRRPLVSMGYTTGREYHKYLGLPYPTQDDKRAAESISGFQKLGQTRSLIYATSNGMGSGCPEFQFFEEEWKNPLNCDTWSFAGCGQYHWGTNPQAESLRDFFLWSTDRALQKFGNDGLYYDFGTVNEVFNPAGGCGYVRDGVQYPTWPLFADRAMRQYIYELFMRKKGHAVFVCHNYSKTVTPLASFMTMLLDGEPYQQKTGVIGAKVTSDYTELIPLSRFATMFGTQFGMIPVFLVKFPDDENPEILRRATHTVQALTLPHGVAIWGFYCDIQELNKAVFIQDDFDLSDAVFVPYYENPRAVFVSPAIPEKILMSYWEKPDGARLVVVSNISGVDYAGSLVFETAQTGQMIEGEHGNPLKLDNARKIRIAVPAKGFRMYRISRR